MTLRLVVHDVPNDGSVAGRTFFEAIFQISPAHWPIADGVVLLSTEVSPTYLRDHLLREMRRVGALPGQLLVSRLAPDMAWHALPEEGVAWLREQLG